MLRFFALWVLVAIAGLTAKQAVATDLVSINDKAVACKSHDDYSRYLLLLTDDVSAAIAYELDKGCVTLEPGTAARLDKGNLSKDTNHVCVRPVGSYDCFWTYAAHVKAGK